MTTFDCPAHPFGEATGLDCQRRDVHDRGHVYAASDAPDRHDLTEPRGHAHG